MVKAKSRTVKTSKLTDICHLQKMRKKETKKLNKMSEGFGKVLLFLN